MFLKRPLTLRAADVSDREMIVTLVRYEQRVHSHLDWKPVEDWLGEQPFLLAEQGRRVVGALACPPDPADTAWIRLFVVAENVSALEAWALLWEKALSQLRALGAHSAAGLSTDGWMEALYQAAGFTYTHNVVVLARPLKGMGPQPAPEPGPVQIRLARSGDDPKIIATDQAAFASPWQLSPAMIETAIAQASLITVAEVEGQIVGYQLTTPSRNGAHLARLAVLPNWQGRGIGTALVTNLIEHYRARGAGELTVNTQDSNSASLKVYQRLGFQLNGARFPVFQLPLG
jgi:[ribosomal protein S18]-alanine N-acetyltransferase